MNARFSLGVALFCAIAHLAVSLYDSRAPTRVIGIEACKRTHLKSVLAEVMDNIKRDFRSDMSELRDAMVLDDDMPDAIGGDIKLLASGIQQQLAAATVKVFVARTQDCSNIYDAGFRTEGAYNINPRGNGVFYAWCRAAWTVVQRRANGAENFNRPWENYAAGFGAVNQDHWLGLHRLYLLTNIHQRTLRVEMLLDYRHGTGNTIYWSQHTNFRVNAAEGYYAYVSGSTSNHGYHSYLDHISGYMFSTYDRDQDGIVHRNCAVEYRGGWWHRPSFCAYARVNGKESSGCTNGNNVCSYWHPWTLRYTLMLVK